VRVEQGKLFYAELDPCGIVQTTALYCGPLSIYSDTEADTDTDYEADTEELPHVGVSPALCLSASVPLCLFSGADADYEAETDGMPHVAVSRTASSASGRSGSPTRYPLLSNPYLLKSLDLYAPVRNLNGNLIQPAVRQNGALR
jgi:hypothetical protein